MVAPLVGAWIETGWRTLRPSYLWSHPSWVRGLKLVLQAVGIDDAVVAPLVGAWIETSCLITKRSQSVVAPLVGAWIETRCTRVVPGKKAMSHPSWVRGLKLTSVTKVYTTPRRTPRGCVD